MVTCNTLVMRSFIFSGQKYVQHSIIPVDAVGFSSCANGLAGWAVTSFDIEPFVPL